MVMSKRALSQYRPQVLSGLINQQYQRLGGISQLGQASAAGRLYKDLQSAVALLRRKLILGLLLHKGSSHKVRQQQICLETLQVELAKLLVCMLDITHSAARSSLLCQTRQKKRHICHPKAHQSNMEYPRPDLLELEDKLNGKTYTN